MSTETVNSLKANASGPEHSGPPSTLALTPFEKFLWSSEDVHSPMVFRVLLRFFGTFNHAELTEAFERALARHPLLTSVIREEDGAVYWSATPHYPCIIWQDGLKAGEPDSGFAVDSINLRTEPGLRVRIVTLDDGIILRTDFHHSCCDGQGARQFVADWFHLYDRTVRSEPPSLLTLEPKRLVDRGIVPERPGMQRVSAWDGLRNFYHTVRGRTVRLREPAAAQASGNQPTASLFEHALTEQQTAILRHRLRAEKVSVNDLGLALAMTTFVETFPDIRSRHRITVMNPVDLRMPSDRRLPATNRTGITYLRRRPHECRTLAPLLRSIRDQTDYIKEFFVAAEFLHGLAAADGRQSVHTGIRRLGWFIPTMHFTCLGNTTRGRRYGFPVHDGIVTVGNLRLDRVSGFAPLLSGVPLSVTASETNSRLLLTVRCRLDMVTAQRAEIWLKAIAAGFVSWSSAVNDGSHSD